MSSGMHRGSRHEKSYVSNALRWGLIIAVIVLLSYGRRHAPYWAQNIALFVIYLIAVISLGYFSLRAVSAKRHYSSPVGGTTLVIRSVPVMFFYVGLVAVAVSVVLTAAASIYVVTNPGDIVHSINDLMNSGVSEPVAYFSYGFLAWVVGYILVWIGAYQIRIMPTLLEYWSLGCGYRALRLSDIEAAYGRVDFSRGWKGPPISLVIAPIKGRGLKTIYINMKVFRAKNLQRVYTWLGAKLVEHPESLG